MKEKIFNPASTNSSSPSEGMASVHTFNPEEMDQREPAADGIPKNFEKKEERAQQDDTTPIPDRPE